MGVEMKGLTDLIGMISDQEILWAKKRRAVSAAAEQAAEHAQDASKAFSDKGYLERSWKFSFFNSDGVATARVYSSAYHDIYNELGSPGNMKHVGFFSREIDRNTDLYHKIIEDEVFDDYGGLGV